VICSKIAEPIEMPFQIRTGVGPHWFIPLNYPRAAAMQHVVKLL